MVDRQSGARAAALIVVAVDHDGGRVARACTTAMATAVSLRYKELFLDGVGRRAGVAIDHYTASRLRCRRQADAVVTAIPLVGGAAIHGLGGHRLADRFTYRTDE